MQIIATNGYDTRFASLCEELDATLNAIVGGETQRKQYIQFNTPEAVSHVLLLEEGGQAVACCGIKPYAETTAEVKRVFTKPAYQGRGYARLLMAELERQAIAQGYTRLILETGRLLMPAIRLYTAIGFERIENYGQYRNMPESVCMAKQIV